MNTTEATPRPWVLSDGADYPENMAQCILDGIGTDREWTAIGVEDKDGYAYSVAYCHPSNAALICKAVNSFDEVREVLAFYAKEENWREIETGIGMTPSIASSDEGGLARTLLAKLNAYPP